MYIKKLILNSFGKFQNTHLELSEGLNIIYGDNEAGKSTMHKFIEGMLYGFYKPYMKNKKVTEDYDKYLPWYNGQQFNGILIYEHEDCEYRVERNFLKRNDKVEIYNNRTGEKITDQYDYDPVTKLHQPHSKHFKINQPTFTNTISIKQLGSMTNDDLVREVKDRLANLSRSKDEQISIKKVLGKLDEKLDVIGNTRRKKSRYGMLIDRINELKEEKEQAAKIWEDIHHVQEQVNAYNKELNQLTKMKRDYIKQLEFLKYDEYKKKYEHALKINQELSLLHDKIDELKNFDKIELDVIDTMMKNLTHQKLLKATLDENKEQLEEFRKKCEVQQEQLKNQEYFNDNKANYIEGIIGEYHVYGQLVQDMKNLNSDIQLLEQRIHETRDNRYESIEKDAYTYEDLDEEKINLKLDYNENDSQRYAEKIRSQKGRLRLYTIVIIALLGLFTLSMGVTIVKPNIILLIADVLLPIAGIMNMIQRQKAVKAFHVLKDKADQLKRKLDEKQARFDFIEKRQKEILEQYNCQSKGELRQLKDQFSSRYTLLAENKRRYQVLIEKRDRVNEQISEKDKCFKYWLGKVVGTSFITEENIRVLKDNYNSFKETEKLLKDNKIKCVGLEEKYKQLNQQYQELSTAIDHFYDTLDVDTQPEMEIIKKKKLELEELKLEYKNKRYVKQNILGDYTLEGLESKLHDFEQIEFRESQMTSDELNLALEQVNDKIIRINKEVSGMNERVNNVENTTRLIVDIEQDLYAKTNEKITLDNKISSLTLANQALEFISKDIQNNFAPELNNQVSHVISEITNNKYSDIKITPDMEVLTKDPDNNQLVPIQQLSSGTIDQMYFGLRLGIMDVINKGANLPLILDDCFVQYDHDRLTNMLTLLSKLNRQVILFTCHTREHEAMNENGLSFNKITLSS